jgi:hypothetical protein
LPRGIHKECVIARDDAGVTVTLVEPALPCPTKPKSQRFVAGELGERLEQAVLIAIRHQQP